MSLDAKDFPLYELLLKLNQPGVEMAKADFVKAQTGGPEEKYGFAMGLYTLAGNDDFAKDVPGLTPAIQKKTLESCLNIFNDAAASGHAGAATMSAMCYTYGQGTAPDIVKARSQLTKAEDLGGTNAFTEQLRAQVGPKIFCKVRKPPGR